MATRNSGEARLRKDTASATRGTRSQADTERTEADGSGMTDEERRAFIRSEFTQEALPSVPAQPGWHFCWLATNNSYDPIHKRIRMGYLPVKTSEVPELESFKLTSGEFAGAVSCNEMVLFKVPEATYQMIMSEFHHNMPLEEEQALKSRLLVPDGADHKDRTGKPLGEILEESDYDELGSAPRRAPDFVV